MIENSIEFEVKQQQCKKDTCEDFEKVSQGRLQWIVTVDKGYECWIEEMVVILSMWMKLIGLLLSCCERGYH